MSIANVASPVGRKGKRKERKKAERALSTTGNLSSVSSPKVAEIVVMDEKKARDKAFRGHPHLMLYAKTLDNPNKVRGVKSPVSVNVAPSLFSTTGTTTALNRVTVAANTASAIYLFPGAVSGQAIENVSPYATSCLALTINVTNYMPGPIQEGGAAGGPVMGVLTSGLAIGAHLGSYNTAASSPITPAQQLPYASVSGEADVRWRLVSMEINVHNVTVELNRGGSIVSCNPVHAIDSNTYTTQNAFSVYDSFEQHGPNSARVVWRPAAKDLGYWHYNAAVTTKDHQATGVYVWLNADAAQAQTYEYEVVCNWELAGNLLRAVVTPSTASRQLTPIAQDAIDAIGHMPRVTTSSPPTSSPSYYQKAMAAAQKVGSALHAASQHVQPIMDAVVPVASRIALEHIARGRGMTPTHRLT